MTFINGHGEAAAVALPKDRDLLFLRVRKEIAEDELGDVVLVLRGLATGSLTSRPSVSLGHGNADKAGSLQKARASRL